MASPEGGRAGQCKYLLFSEKLIMAKSLKQLDKKKDSLKELSRMLYKDMRKSGDSPQAALTKVVVALSPLMR